MPANWANQTIWTGDNLPILCAGCGEHFQARHLEVDHIISRRKGGSDHTGNLQLLCGSCNRIKGDRGMEHLRVKLQL